MSDPPEYLGRICRWLDLRDDAGAIEQMMHPERSPFACFGPLDALFGNDPNFLSGPTFRPHKVKVPPLDQPAPWREDGAGLKPEVVALEADPGPKPAGPGHSVLPEVSQRSRSPTSRREKLRAGGNSGTRPRFGRA